MRRPLTIDGWGGGGFRIGGAWRAGGLLVLDDRAYAWDPREVSAVTVETLAAVISGGPATSEIIILGTGARSAPPAAEMRAVIEAGGMGLEFMATPAAARLHNILVAQGRRIATALLPV